jgi:hypothetical protein
MSHLLLRPGLHGPACGPAPAIQAQRGLSPPIRPRNDPFARLHAELLGALGPEPPLPLPICPLVPDLEDRGEHVRGLLNATYAYLRAVMGDVVQNVPRDLDLRQIEALAADLLSEVHGTMRAAIAALPWGRP